MNLPIDTASFPMTTNDLADISYVNDCKVVVTNATLVFHEGIECVVTSCTRCGKSFGVELRQELTRNGQPIRSIPQCRECRGRYARVKREQEQLDEVLYASVAGRRVPLNF